MAAFGRLSTQALIGIIAILVGVLLLLDNMNLFEAWGILQYWPVILIVLGIAKVFHPAGHERGWGIALIVVGAAFLLRTLDIYYFRFRDLWPLILILIGGSILWASYSRKRSIPEGVTDESVLGARAILGGVKRTMTSRKFRGGEIIAVMGGCEIDLREAEIEGEQAAIQVFVLMGGVEIRIPESWVVIPNGTPILGGFADETRGGPRAPGAKKLVLQGTVIMGGVEVKN